MPALLAPLPKPRMKKLVVAPSSALADAQRRHDGWQVARCRGSARARSSRAVVTRDRDRDFLQRLLALGRGDDDLVAGCRVDAVRRIGARAAPPRLSGGGAGRSAVCAARPARRQRQRAREHGRPAQRRKRPAACAITDRTLPGPPQARPLPTSVASCLSRTSLESPRPQHNRHRAGVGNARRGRTPSDSRPCPARARFG